MNNQLTTTNATPTESEYTVIRTQAVNLLASGFLPASIKTPEQAIAIILTGRDLGISATAALNTINVIQGKPTISPQLMLALIERSGQLQDIEILTGNDYVQVTMQRKNRTEHTERFGHAEAVAMGLASRDNYKKQAAVMYKWRAIAACARTVFPDVILGLYTPDEMGADVNADGEIVTAELDAKHEAERAALKTECGQLFRSLNTHYDKPRWNRYTVTEFINEQFAVTNGIDDLQNEQINELNAKLGAMWREMLEGDKRQQEPEFTPEQVAF